MDQSIIKTNGIINAVLAFSLLGVSHSALASDPTSGKLIIVNSLGIVVNGSAGDSASAIKIEVKDDATVCSTTTSLAYGGVVTISWDASNAPSPTKCSQITSVDVTALKTTASGKVQYDATATTPAATATAATTFTAPTTPIANLVLVVTGNGGAENTGSTTNWGSAQGTKPIYSAVNGSITTTGVMSASGTSGLHAATKMLQHNITPANH
jgi:hypothetical protein